MRFVAMTTCALCALGRLAWAAPALPSDPRLAPVRAQVEQIVTRAEAGGLPAEIIVSKVREGLAKGVDAARIAAAAQRLSDGLGEARAFVVERRRNDAPVELVRAVAESRLAGIEPAANDELVRRGRSASESARAVEVLTDLSLRGYPVTRAAKVVQDVLLRDPGSVARLPSTLEAIRTEQALTQGESVDALAHGISKSNGSLKAAASAVAAGQRAEGWGRGGVKAGEGGTGPGTAGFVPPGQLKKEAGAMKPGAGMGRGQGAGQGKP